MVSVLRCILTNTSNAPLRDRPCFRWTTFMSLWGTLGPQPPTVEKTSACTPSAGRAHFNLSGGPHTGYFRSGHAHSQIMAMRELKLPMLKHSRATSMKNSITCALCFFLAGWGQDQSFSGPASSPLSCSNSAFKQPPPILLKAHFTVDKSKAQGLGTLCSRASTRL